MPEAKKQRLSLEKLEESILAHLGDKSGEFQELKEDITKGCNTHITTQLKLGRALCQMRDLINGDGKHNNEWGDWKVLYIRSLEKSKNHQVDVPTPGELNAAMTKYDSLAYLTPQERDYAVEHGIRPTPTLKLAYGAVKAQQPADATPAKVVRGTVLHMKKYISDLRKQAQMGGSKRNGAATATPVPRGTTPVAVVKDPTLDIMERVQKMFAAAPTLEEARKQLRVLLNNLALAGGIKTINPPKQLPDGWTTFTVAAKADEKKTA